MKNPFTPELAVLCRAAIKKFHTDSELVKHILAEGYRCVTRKLDQISVQYNHPNRAQRDRDLFTTINTMLSQEQRGAYILIERENVQGHLSYQACFAFGINHVHIANVHECYHQQPSGEEIEKRILEFEIHECVKVCRAQDELGKNRQMIREHELKAGRVFDHLKLKSFDTCKIVSVNFECGEVTYLLSSKHTSKIQKSTVLATDFSNIIDLPHWELMHEVFSSPESVQHASH